MIEKRGKRYVLKSKDSGRTLGVHPSRRAAERQETAINMSKARAAGHKLPPPPDERGETMRKIRSGKAKFLIPLVLLVGTAAHAATKTCPSGTLAPTPATTTGPTTDVIVARAIPGLTFQATSPAGTATVAVETSCDGTNWAPLATTMSLATTATSQAVSVSNPACTYRANVTACSSCSVTVAYGCAGP